MPKKTKTEATNHYVYSDTCTAAEKFDNPVKEKTIQFWRIKFHSVVILFL
jgi:hypothetical protein